MGAEDAQAPLLEQAQGGGAIGMGLQLHPFLRALGGVIEGARAAGQAHHMGLHHPHGIAAAQDGREVVGLVHMLQQHGEVPHAAIEHGLEALKAAGQQGHRALGCWAEGLGSIAGWGPGGDRGDRGSGWDDCGRSLDEGGDPQF